MGPWGMGGVHGKAADFGVSEAADEGLLFGSPFSSQASKWWCRFEHRNQGQMFGSTTTVLRHFLHSLVAQTSLLPSGYST